MKRLIILVLAVLLALPAFAQELSKQEKKKLEKELKKEQKSEEAAKRAEVVSAMAEYHKFVLEVNTLRDKRGNSLQVSSNINFIASDSITGVIQVGSNTYIGRNGVGGVTVEGSIADYKYSRNEKNGTYIITYYLRTPVGSYDVRLTAYPDGRGDAEVSSTTWGDRLRYSGNLVPIGISRVFKGSSL